MRVQPEGSIVEDLQTVPEQTDADADADAAQPEAPEPKPVFEGDWNSATGVEKGRHSERVRQWRKREEAREAAEARRRMGSGSEQQAARTTSAASPSGPGQPVDPTRAVLEAIRDNPSAHDSDRIRAAQQLIALDRVGDAEAQGGSDLVALRDTLALLQPEERLAWLQGERLKAMGSARGA